MVDTIRLRFNRFTISPNCPFAITGQSVNGETESPHPNPHQNRFLFQDEQGRRFFGSRAVLLTTPFRVEINPTHTHPHSTSAQGDLTVYGSVPGINRLHNYFSLSGAGFHETLLNVENHLRDLGVSLDIMGGILSRVDLFRNVVLDEPCGDYAFLLNRLQCRRMSPCHHPTGTSYRWENQQHQVALYDKRAHLVHGHRDISGIPPNVLRFEYRLMKARKVRQVLGMGTVAELIEGYDTLPSIMAAQIHRLLSFSPATTSASFGLDAPRSRRTNGETALEHGVAGIEGVSQLIEDMRQFRSDGRGNWRHRFFATYGLNHWIHRVGRDGVVEAHDDISGRCRQRRHDFNRDINEAQTLANVARGLAVDSPLNRRFRELRAKLFETDLEYAD